MTSKDPNAINADAVKIHDAGVAASVTSGASPNQRVFSRVELAKIQTIGWTADAQHATMGRYVRVKDASEYEHLPNLEELWLDENQLRDTSGVHKLSSLRLLSVRLNGLRNLDGIQGLAHLHTLYADVVDDLSGLKDLPSLATLAVGARDYSPLLALPALEKLEVLYFEVGQDVRVLAELLAKGVAISGPAKMKGAIAAFIAENSPTTKGDIVAGTLTQFGDHGLLEQWTLAGPDASVGILSTLGTSHQCPADQLVRVARDLVSRGMDPQVAAAECLVVLAYVQRRRLPPWGLDELTTVTSWLPSWGTAEASSALGGLYIRLQACKAEDRPALEASIEHLLSRDEILCQRSGFEALCGYAPAEVVRKAIELGVLKGADDNGRFLSAAVRTDWAVPGRLEVVERLVEAGVDVNSPAGDGYGAPFLNTSSVEMLEYLLAQGADLYTRNGKVLLPDALLSGLKNGRRCRDLPAVLGRLIDEGMHLGTALDGLLRLGGDDVRAELARRQVDVNPTGFQLHDRKQVALHRDRLGLPPDTPAAHFKKVMKLATHRKAVLEPGTIPWRAATKLVGHVELKPSDALSALLESLQALTASFLAERNDEVSTELAKLQLSRPELEVAMLWLDDGPNAVNAQGRTPLHLVHSSQWSSRPEATRDQIVNALIRAGVPVWAKAHDGTFALEAAKDARLLVKMTPRKWQLPIGG